VTPAQRKWLPWLTAVGFFMQTLDGTILNTALPSMAETLGESPLQMQSVVIAYMLTVALLIPASGWLADRFGTRRIYLAAILLFTLGSLACAAANTLPMLVAARVLQGVGGALLMPIGRLAVLRVYSKHELLRVMSFVTIPGWKWRAGTGCFSSICRWEYSALSRAGTSCRTCGKARPRSTGRDL